MKLFDFKWFLPALGDYFTFYDFGKDEAPPPPDYAAAARETAQGNLDMARAATAANRVNQVTPYGNLTYTQSGTDQYGNPMWTATQELSPEQDRIRMQQAGLNSGLLTTAQRGLDYAGNLLEKPGIDMSTLPSVGINPGEMYSDAIMRRLQPQLKMEQGQFDAKMANQGIAPGTEAYNNAKRDFDQTQNDKLTAAQIGGINTGLNANQQAFAQQGYNQMQPINVINALRTGSQVAAPSYVNPALQATTQGPDLLGATGQQYDAQLAQTNANNAGISNFTSGLMNMGGAILGGPKYSDERLKTNIKRIGTHDLGIGIYSYNYKDGHNLPKGLQIGVMAQELEKVLPEAVVTMANGYKAVHYGLI
jgi:hypothetical protein